MSEFINASRCATRSEIKETVTTHQFIFNYQLSYFQNYAIKNLSKAKTYYPFAAFLHQYTC